MTVPLIKEMMMMNKKKGFIHGGFDIFNCTHLYSIRQAKLNCDELTVGVYTDEYCEIVFGKKPIIPFSDRIGIVEALYDVDLAVEINEISINYYLGGCCEYYCYEEKGNQYEVRGLIRPSNKISNGTELSKKPYKIGYTTGCFDMFHKGHLNILKRSKEMCEYLIVGVSVDSLVMEYKGHPCSVPFEERAAIISNIKYVDRVVPQINLDKRMAWDDLRFDVLFHGSDYKGSKLFNDVSSKLKQVGADTLFFDYTEGISSTIIKSRL